MSTKLAGLSHEGNTAIDRSQANSRRARALERIARRGDFVHTSLEHLIASGTPHGNVMLGSPQQENCLFGTIVASGPWQLLSLARVDEFGVRIRQQALSPGATPDPELLALAHGCVQAFLWLGSVGNAGCRASIREWFGPELEVVVGFGSLELFELEALGLAREGVLCLENTEVLFAKFVAAPDTPRTPFVPELLQSARLDVLTVASAIAAGPR